MVRISLSGTAHPTAYTKRQRATMFLAIAMEFRGLARHRGRTPAYPHVRLFLRGRTLELSLKAYLLLSGASTKDLKNVGHCLQRALTSATKAGLAVPVITPKAQQQMESFDRFYRAKRFEYYSSIDLLLPSATDSYRAFWRFADLVHQAVLRSFLAAA